MVGFAKIQWIKLEEGSQTNWSLPCSGLAYLYEPNMNLLTVKAHVGFPLMIYHVRPCSLYKLQICA